MKNINWDLFKEELRKTGKILTVCNKMKLDSHYVYNKMKSDNEFKFFVENARKKPFNVFSIETKNKILNILNEMINNDLATIKIMCEKYGISNATFNHYVKNDNDAKKIFNEIRSVDIFCPKCGKLTKTINVSIKNRGRFLYHKQCCSKCRKENDKITRTKKHNFFVSMVCRMKRYDKKRFGCENDLTADFLENLFKKQQGKCFYTKKELKFNTKDKFEKCSLDRLDSSKPHYCNNVVLCSWGINEMKKDNCFETFITICNLVCKTFNPVYTSQMCSQCREIHKESRNGEIYRCINCGTVLDADVNGAINILNRFKNEEFTVPHNTKIQNLIDSV